MSAPSDDTRNKDVRAEAAVLHRLGYEYDGLDSRGHLVFEHPDHEGCVTLACSPSRRGWRFHTRRAVAAHLGVTPLGLEAMINGQARVGRRRKSGRKRSRPPAARHLHVAPEALAAPPVPEAKPDREAEPEIVLARELGRVADCLPSDPIGSRDVAWKQIEKAKLGLAARERLEHPWPWPRRSEAA